MHKCKFLRNFAAELNKSCRMAKKKIIFLILFCAFCLCAHAETLLLRTGARVKGTIVFQNEEVVILRDAEGARFQYPRAEVQEILSDETEKNESRKEADDQIADDQQVNKKASILLELAGGVAVNPNEAVGGAFSVDLLVGSHHIGDRHLFVGAGVGYHGLFLGEEKYNFLPVQAALRMPLTETKHAPAFGVAVGYGIALSKEYLGGLYAGVDFGYRCRINPRTAVALMAFAQFQQAIVPSVTVIDGNEFTARSGRSLVTSGLKLALYF